MTSKCLVTILVLLICLCVGGSVGQGAQNTAVSETDATQELVALGQPGGRPGRVLRRKGRRRRIHRRKNVAGGGSDRKATRQQETVPIVNIKATTPGTAEVAEVKLSTAMRQSQSIVAPIGSQVVIKTSVPKQNVAVGLNVAQNVVRKANSQFGGASGQDTFFDLFDATTTVEPSAAGPPPGIDVDRKPGIKVMPTVDTANAVAHDGTPCNETYKGHETIKTKYMMKYAEGVWETLDCPPNLASGLVWRQDLCACGEELIAQDPNDWCAQMGFNQHPDNPHKYNRRHHGVDAVMDCAASLVWSQEKCLCMYDPTVKDRPIEQKVTFVCKTILQLKFEGNLKNTAEGYNIKPVELHRRGKLPRIRFRKIPGSTDKAAMIVSQPLEFLAYRGNDFQLQVTYSLSFKISPRHTTRTNFMVLLSDECLGTQGGQNRSRTPSISVAFQPNTKTFRLQFRTENQEIDELIQGAKPDKDGWYNVVVYFEDESLNLENNGLKLFSIPDIKGKIPQNKCPLYIAGRGPDFDRSQDFYGYLDNVNLIKDCKFHESNIKFL